LWQWNFQNPVGQRFRVPGDVEKMRHLLMMPPTNSPVYSTLGEDLP
jgi:hypothetical protein